MSTFNDIATDAFIKNGLLAAGETLDPNQAAYAMREANRLLDQWNIQSLFIFTQVIYLFTLTTRPIVVNGVSQYWYTIGPASSVVAGPPAQPDFVAVRPNYILRANLVLNVTTPNTRVALAILDDRQWAAETVPALGTAPYPSKLYYDYGFDTSGAAGVAQGCGKIYLHPYPNQTGNQLELFVPNQVARFAAVTDTFNMPMGWEDPFMLTLSERTIEGLRAIPATLSQAAARARANLRSMNSRSPKISTLDTGMPGNRRSGNGNVFNGWPIEI